MASYKYKARDEEGNVISGRMKAVDENDLHEKLKNDNMFLLDLKEETSTRKGTKRLKLDRLADFARSISKLWLESLIPSYICLVGLFLTVLSHN